MTEGHQGISVIMPTYNQCAFILSAIKSLQQQTYKLWELIIINDGCTDRTKELLQTLLPHEKIRYYENPENFGLGACLNLGIQQAQYDYIAYLPSDDLYFKNHLESLAAKLFAHPKAVLAYSGLRYNYNYTLNGDKCPVAQRQIPGRFLQLVQVLHRKTTHKWLERNELVTDNLFSMFWKDLTDVGMFIPTSEITCEQTNHAWQRHKIINKVLGGGLTTFRTYYEVKEPVRFCSSSGDYFDEKEYYAPFQLRQGRKEEGLKILLVGELSYNPERIYSFEEHGHSLYGLWIERPSIFYNVGPLPFGDIIDVSRKNWKEAVTQIKPDIIYGLLNTPAIELAHEVLKADLDIPFIWHFKEGPFFARNTGVWEKLCDLYSLSDGQIYISELSRSWFQQFVKPLNDFSFILDGDLAKKEWFEGDRSPKLSERDGEIHTVFIGRPIGISSESIAALAAQNIHVHFYGIYQVVYKEWIRKNKVLAPKHFHVHSNCFPNNWTQEFSQYDAGWLHNFESENDGDLLKVNWHDLNLPSRMSTLAAAGLPMIQRNNSEHLVATQQLTQYLDVGIFYDDFDDLKKKLSNKERIRELQENSWRHRMHFSFDHHLPDLIGFFKVAIERKQVMKSVLKGSSESVKF